MRNLRRILQCDCPFKSFAALNLIECSEIKALIEIFYSISSESQLFSHILNYFHAFHGPDIIIFGPNIITPLLTWMIAKSITNPTTDPSSMIWQWIRRSHSPKIRFRYFCWKPRVIAELISIDGHSDQARATIEDLKEKRCIPLPVKPVSSVYLKLQTQALSNCGIDSHFHQDQAIIEDLSGFGSTTFSNNLFFNHWLSSIWNTE